MDVSGIGGSWTGVAEVQAALTRLIAQADLAAKEIVAKTASQVVAQAQRNFQGSHKRGEPHSGGMFPNVVTGTLRRSIMASPIQRQGIGSYSTTVGPRAIYGRAVELGLRNGAAYPYFGPAVKKVQPDIAKIAAEVWLKHLGL